MVTPSPWPLTISNSGQTVVQTADRARHKPLCKQLSKHTSDATREAAKLRDCPTFFRDTRINYFMKAVGNFWSMDLPRTYCYAHFMLPLAITDEARVSGSPALWQRALGHLLELMRLNTSDNQGVRDSVPHTLLRLNRDTDAYAFIKVRFASKNK